MWIRTTTLLRLLLAFEVLPSLWLWASAPTDSVRVWYPTIWSYVGEHACLFGVFLFSLAILLIHLKWLPSVTTFTVGVNHAIWWSLIIFLILSPVNPAAGVFLALLVYVVAGPLRQRRGEKSQSSAQFLIRVPGFTVVVFLLLLVFSEFAASSYLWLISLYEGGHPRMILAETLAGYLWARAQVWLIIIAMFGIYVGLSQRYWNRSAQQGEGPQEETPTDAH